MQTGDQARSRNWKVVASVAAASALGITGVALANSGGPSNPPDPIRLDDTSPAVETSTTVRRVPTTVADALRLGADTASAGSPASRVGEVSAESPQTASSPQSAHSPQSAATPPSPASPQSPQSPPDPPSPDSPASADSPAQPESPASPASAPSADSPGSADSGD